MISDKSHVLRQSNAAKLCGVAVQTFKYYVEKGWIAVAEEKDGVKFFNKGDVLELKRKRGLYGNRKLRIRTDRTGETQV